MPEWEKVPLSRMLTKSTLLETPMPGRNYEQAGVQLWGKGAYARDKIDGGDTAYKLFNKVVEGDVVMNKIWARNGAVAVVPEELDGHYVSTEFPVYAIDREQMEPMWMRYITQQKWFWKSCDEKSFGTSGKNRIKPERFLEIEVPLPPRPEQQRIVFKIEAVRQRLARITGLRAEQRGEMASLLFSKYTEAVKSAPWERMGSVAPIVRREVDMEDEAAYPELGIRSFGKGTFHKPALSGLDVGSKKLYRIEMGDLLFSNVFAWEGAIAVAKYEDDGRYGSHRFISCVADKDKALEEFLCYHFLTPSGLQDINACSPGGAGRNKTLGLTKLMDILVPVPDVDVQREFVRIRNKVYSLQNEHLVLNKKLADIIPSILHQIFQRI